MSSRFPLGFHSLTLHIFASFLFVASSNNNLLTAFFSSARQFLAESYARLHLVSIFRALKVDSTVAIQWQREGNIANMVNCKKQNVACYALYRHRFWKVNIFCSIFHLTKPSSWIFRFRECLANVWQRFGKFLQIIMSAICCWQFPKIANFSPNSCKQLSMENVRKYCRFRRTLQNEELLSITKLDFDTAENELSKIWPNLGKFQCL